eukprot:4016906-Prorocentrum_lima.AAC.1
MMWVGMQSKSSTLKMDSSLDAWGGMGSCSRRAYVPSKCAVLLESIPAILDVSALILKQLQPTVVNLVDLVWGSSKSSL